MAKGSIAVLALALAVSGCMVSVPVRQAAQEQPFAERISVVDDVMRTAVIVRSPSIPLNSPSGDIQVNGYELVAAIDRKTGLVSYAVHHAMNHRLGEWFFPSSATYLDAAGEPSRATGFVRTDSKVDYCSSYGCRYREFSAFNVPRETLEAVVAAYRSERGPRHWRVRVNGRRAFVEGLIDVENIADFVAAVDAAAARRVSTR